MTITEAIRKHGLEFLRGRVVNEGSQSLFINDKDLDSAIDLWRDDPEYAYLQRRFYGSEVRNDPMRCVWIYGTFQVEETAFVGSRPHAQVRAPGKCLAVTPSHSAALSASPASVALRLPTIYAWHAKCVDPHNGDSTLAGLKLVALWRSSGGASPLDIYSASRRSQVSNSAACLSVP